MHESEMVSTIISPTDSGDLPAYRASSISHPSVGQRRTDLPDLKRGTDGPELFNSAAHCVQTG